MKITTVVNLFGGPGIGKSTTAAAIFSLLKLHGMDAELVTEYPKDLVWEKREETKKNQVYVFGKQHHRIWRVYGQVDIIVTDSPCLLTAAYTDDPLLQMLAVKEFKKTAVKSFNFMLVRTKPYNPNGRWQDEKQAREKDQEIHRILDLNVDDFQLVPGDINGVNWITKEVLGQFNVGMKYLIKEE